MLVTCRQMQEMEEGAFAQGVQASDLMEVAGIGIAQVIRHFFLTPGTLILYLGSGNNAGDALVAGRELQKQGWTLLARLSGEPGNMKALPLKHWNELKGMERLHHPPLLNLQAPVVLLDGLLGIGSQGPLRPSLSALAQEMNQLRISHRAVTVAMDIPSGLDGDTGQPHPDCVVADITATVAACKKGLVADAATHHVGRLALVPLPQLAPFMPKEAIQENLLTPEFLRPHLPRRNFDFHKGQAGRVGILAGSRGYYGAAELACRAALRAGAGLVTLIVKEDAYDILACRVPPEVMVKSVQDYREVLNMRFDAIGIGPGLGFTDEAEYIEMIRQTSVRCVVDADALTALARQEHETLDDCVASHLFTPHPGEMARLLPNCANFTRREQAASWTTDHLGHTLLLKGARTVIATHGLDTLYNTTGHPGMAIGGMGDVLTGVSAALIGQGIRTHFAAGLAAWLCGRAAEIHARAQAAESTLPTDVIRHLGQAWAEL
ncbi:NAD(P)H-hydrate dehydratase [Prosthecobacter dejongeii]|uniref:ADP-dependent (S)-NAD(P)H-hydrate dehydratase n=1 Tax=Prosthecobacter dejongeii TaxID=48465 RepID=A0A7W7YQ82_9BACT|nr:NAD(P)H-hydrate dehydratase [Prosthecobacter dejongeii]MBB5040358.1 NAD(P)H-hydrate epimerase [Prosthecobacter dejongeii]